MIIKEICPNVKCGKTQKEISFSIGGGYKLIKLECGHTVCKKLLIDSTKEAPRPFILKSFDDKEPRPYQYEGIEFATSKGLRVLFADEMGLGKGGPHSEPILTPSGWKTYGTITLEDKVIGADGKAHNITAIYDRGILQTYRVSFNDGSYTIVDADHLWEVNTPVRKNRGNPSIVKSTISLKANLFGSTNSTGKKNLKWYIPVTKPVEMLEQINKIDPYSMGLLLGDGCFTEDYRVSYATEDQELLFALRLGLNSVSGELEYTGSGCNFRVNKCATLRAELKNYGLAGKYSHEKFVPDTYKFNTIKNRLAMLRGLMDTDGSIWNNGIIEFTSSSQQLANDVKFLVESLGGIALISTKIPTFEYKGEKKEGKLCYRVVINIGINPFLLRRKARLYKENTKYSPTRGITSIEPHSVEPVICISTNAPRNLYLTRDCIVTHNTVQFLGSLLKNKDKVFPCIIVTKKSLLTQTAREILRWMGKDYLAQTIHSSKEFILPGLNFYIISYDMVKKFGYVRLKEEIKPQSLVLDECQAIKNADADRTVAVQRLSVGIPYALAASGTYIKNNAAEAFSIFNILRPERFPSRQGFINEFVDAYQGAYGSKYGGIKRWALDSWKATLSEFVIRRERSEVLTELPPLNRSFFYTELGDDVERMYKQAMKGFLSAVDDMESSGGWDKAEARSNVLSYITKMRHITGISKIDPCISQVGEFLEETDRKLAIFVHHQDVGEMLYRKLDELCAALRLSGAQIGPPVQYTSAMDMEARNRAIDRFKSPQCRVGVFSTLAAGEGLNLQFCSDMYLLERQWNPANEEQVEGRFNRIGQVSQVNATYFLAGGTIDEYFSELVEAKRKNMLQTMRGEDNMSFSEGSLMRELTEIIAAKGGKKWKL